jgi:hypothetical protein
VRSDSGRRPERDATYANILCAAAEPEPPRAPREPVPLTVIDLGVTLGSTALFTDASELKAMINSGASSACISPKNKFFDYLVVGVVDEGPNFGMKVGDAVVLPCVQIVKLGFRGALALDCFRLVQGKKVRARLELDVHRVLVVEGLDPNIILLSVQILRVLYGVLVYFNKNRIDNCLKLRNGLFCELRTDRCAYELKFAPRAAVAAKAAAASALPDIAVSDAFFDRRTRDALRVHAALGHVGANTINISNVTLSGIRPAGLKEPHLCTGCRLSARRPAAAGGTERCAALQRPTCGARRPSTSARRSPLTAAPRCLRRSRTSSHYC